jgi:hypothetical protein
MEWGHLANLIRMGLHHQLLSKGSFEMKRVIITFFATLMATNAFAQTQISPDQMRAGEIGNRERMEQCWR